MARKIQWQRELLVKANSLIFYSHMERFSMVVSDQEIVRRLKETIEFLKVEAIGGIWNTQLIDMLEDLFKEDSKIHKNKDQ